MRDGHRVFVGPDDRLGNAAQIRALVGAGYDGPFSFEPFSPSVHGSSDPRAAIAGSMEFLRENT
jgi:2-keto-myo-inositol isomerase